jgi:hypothetical protein
MDEQGRIYFIEYHQEGSKMICTLSRFDPQNNKLVKIASREGFIRHVGLDAGNNIYYVLGDLFAPNEIHKISRDLKTDILCTEQRITSSSSIWPWTSWEMSILPFQDMERREPPRHCRHPD